jgi:hypothetical protein
MKDNDAGKRLKKYTNHLLVKHRKWPLERNKNGKAILSQEAGNIGS